jgi:hypothetical protein
VYSSGAFGLNVFQKTLTLWLVYFYAPPPETGRPILVPMLLLGIVLTFGRVVDAGRRRPDRPLERRDALALGAAPDQSMVRE